MNLDFQPAPYRTQWGVDMVVACIELSKDATADLYLHKEDIPLLHAALEKLLAEETPR
jgi:hypothetical protein